MVLPTSRSHLLDEVITHRAAGGNIQHLVDAGGERGHAEEKARKTVHEGRSSAKNKSIRIRTLGRIGRVLGNQQGRVKFDTHAIQCAAGVLSVESGDHSTGGKAMMSNEVRPYEMRYA